MYKFWGREGEREKKNLKLVGVWPARLGCSINFMCSFNHVTGHPHQTHLYLYSHSFIHLNLDTH